MITILSEREAMEHFDELLDDCNEPMIMGSLTFYPHDVLKRCDPIAYRCDFIDFVNSMAEDGNFYVEGYTDDMVNEVD